MILLLILQLINLLSAQHLPMCPMQGDTFGEWKSVEDIERSQLSLREYERHFFGGGPGEAMEFTNVWIPKDCSMHRFTNSSIHLAVEYMRHKLNYTDDKPLHWIIMGDSGTRGMLCGIVRILSGSEILGPCINRVCGDGTRFEPVSTPEFGKYYDLDFGLNFRITFVYVKTFEERHFDWMLEFSITVLKPYLYLFNTGAWSFDEIARQQKEPASEYCNSNVTESISINRASPFVNLTMRWLGDEAKKNNVRTIYRNNHYNTRFGVHCADDRLEEMLQGTSWEILDSRRISHDVYLSQTYDGFHVDRIAHSVEEHIQLNKLCKENNKEIPGQLEIQLAQSFLNMALYDALVHIHERHVVDHRVIG